MRGLPLDPLPLARSVLTDDEGVFVVGGRVRDVLLDRQTLDTDLTIPSGALDAARRVAAAGGGAFVVLDEARDVARVVWPFGNAQAVLDVAAYTGATIQDDLHNRDLTINAMAVALQSSWPPRPESVLDPLQGRADLDRKILRTASRDAFEADPIRLLRVVRLGAELGFGIEDGTRDLARRHASAIRRSAQERVRDELMKALATPRCSAALDDFEDLGLLRELLPELEACRGQVQSPPHTDDVFDHTRAVVGALVALQLWLGEREASEACLVDVPGRWWEVLDRYRQRLHDHLFAVEHQPATRTTLLRFAALLHDTGKPGTAETTEHGRTRFLNHEVESARLAGAVCARLRLSARDTAYVTTVVRHHPRPLALALSGGASRRAVYRFYEAAGDAGVDVVVHALADNLVKAPLDDVRANGLAQVASDLFEAWFDRRAERVDPPPILGGLTLMEALRLEPGPEVGRLLAAVREAQAAGDVIDADGALDLARRLHAGSRLET